MSAASRVVRETARERGDEVVLETPDGELTYRQLNDDADLLAHRLVGSVDGPNQPIALQVAGTGNLLLSTLAISRAGMVAIVVDPTTPAPHRDEILRDSGAMFLITDLAGATDQPVTEVCPTIDPASLPTVGTHAPRGPTELVPHMDLPVEKMSAVVYTSGSTGRPKGIVKPAVWELSLSDDPAVNQRLIGSRLGFMGQGSVGWAPRLLLLAVECRSQIAAYEVRRPRQDTIGEWLARAKVEWFVTVPTVMRGILNNLAEGAELPDLHTVFLYGETVTGQDVARLLAVLRPGAVVVDGFGTTEGGFFSMPSFSLDRMPEPGPIPIPVPPAGSRFKLSIEDDEGRAVPIGQPGQLVVSTPATGLGYLNDSGGLDSEVFQLREGGRIHTRTGDLGRLRPDGLVEHLGRSDGVVKVSGNRVDLAAVELLLLEQPELVEAAAAPYLDHNGDTRLTAAVVTATDEEVSPGLLRAEVARRLPGFMVPDEVLVLPELPRLSNGKANRRELASLRQKVLNEPARDRGGEAHSQPADAGSLEAVAETLRAIFCDVLDRRGVGLHDDFFDLGGDSLRAMEVMHDIEQRLGVRCSPAVLLRASSAFDLARALRMGGTTATSVSAVQLGTPGRQPLFVVDAGTNAFVASGLASLLGSSRPVYELWASADAPSFEQAAAACVEALTAVAPTGPYALYGFSLSGVLAFEMALQLQAQGRPPNLLVLGDSTAPGSLPRLSRGFAMGRRTLEDPRPSTVARRVVELAGRHRWNPSARPEVNEWDRHFLLVSKYRPSAALAARVVLHRAHFLRPYGYRGWQRHVAGGLQVRDIRGDHLDLIGSQLPDSARALLLDLGES